MFHVKHSKKIFIVTFWNVSRETFQLIIDTSRKSTKPTTVKATAQRVRVMCFSVTLNPMGSNPLTYALYKDIHLYSLGWRPTCKRCCCLRSNSNICQ